MVEALPHRPWRVWKESPPQPGEIALVEPVEPRRNPADEEFWTLDWDEDDYGPALHGIVAAVNAVPALLDQVERLERENVELTKRMQPFLRQEYLASCTEVDWHLTEADIERNR